MSFGKESWIDPPVMSDYLHLFSLVSPDMPGNLERSARESMESHLLAY